MVIVQLKFPSFFIYFFQGRNFFSFFRLKFFFFPFDGRARVAGLCPALREEVGLYYIYIYI